MRSVNEHLNEQTFGKDKYQGAWSGEKYVVVKHGKDKIELIGDKHKSPKQQIYTIKKNGEQVATFDYDTGSDSYWVTSEETKGSKSFETIDDLIAFIKKEKGKGLWIHDGSMK
jgi:uncharacterized protein YkuJ